MFIAQQMQINPLIARIIILRLIFFLWTELFSFSTHGSLCKYLRDSYTDLPLVPLDDETERLIWEKDEEVRKMFV